jgi:hypothetical protein
MDADIATEIRGSMPAGSVDLRRLPWLPEVDERRHNVFAVPAPIHVNEWSINNCMPAAFDVRKRRVDDMVAMIATVVTAMAPVIVVVVMNFDEIR